MPAITYKEFGGGLDRRLPIGVQDANRLWTLKNAYITSGKKIKKRPGLRVVSTGDLQFNPGLESINGAVTVFRPYNVATTPTGLSGIKTPPAYDFPHLGGGGTLYDVLYSERFNGFQYTVGLYLMASGPYIGQYKAAHFYGDSTTTTAVTDTNCPHGASVTKAVARIFSTGGEKVSYCAANLPFDWTTASNAGSLATSLQQDTKADCTAVGTFEGTLVVMFPEGAQLWAVAVDPAANQITRRLYAVGTQYPQSLATFYRDLVFASPYGVRSISVQELVERIDETDVGVPIDSLIKVTQAQFDSEFPSGYPRVNGIWLQQLGQYWLSFPHANGTTTVYAYSFSKSSKLACWSVYEFPIRIYGICANAGKVYVRNLNTLYELADDQYTDNGTTIAVDVQMAYQDAKQPGVEKMFYGADFVFTGTAAVSYLYDPRDTGKETNSQSISGDTRPATVVPVEVSTSAIAPRFQHSANEAFEIDSVTLYFHPLSAMSS